MKNVIKQSILTLAVFSTIGSAMADAAAEAILKKARLAATVQQQDLDGSIKKNGKSSPLKIFFRGQNIQFTFFDGKKWIKFHMRLKDGGGELFEIVNNKTIKFDSKKIGQPVLGTDLTYEDLALSFLYWKRSSVVKQERIKTLNCDVLRMENSSKTSGNYGLIYPSISQKHGALMRILGYDRNGQLLKDFSVEKVMKVKGGYGLQQMKVTSYKGKKVVGHTYLNFKAPVAVLKPLE